MTQVSACLANIAFSRNKSRNDFVVGGEVMDRFVHVMLAPAAMLLASPVVAQDWSVAVQPGGYQVARAGGDGTITGIGLTCERAIPVIALQLARPAPRSPAVASVSVGGYTARLALIRNGTTNVWVAVLRDRVLLDTIAGSAVGTRLSVTVDGGQGGNLSLGGVRSAMQRALGGCYQLPAMAAPAGPVPAATTSLPPLDVSRQVFPFKSGRYATGGSCAAAEQGEGNASIWTFAAKKYHEYEADENWVFGKFTLLSPERFRTSEQPGGVQWERRGTGFVRTERGSPPQAFRWCAPLTPDDAAMLR